MNFYQRHIVPPLTHLAMRHTRLVPFRKRVVGAAEGRVLEIGIGSGLNFPLYGTSVSSIIGLEPSAELRRMAGPRALTATAQITLLDASAEAIPLDSDSIDTVVTTWTLCTIPEAVVALGEMRRVLRRSGCLVFVEHGLAPDESVRRWQDRLTPLWRRISGGCHLNRPIRAMIESGGFRFERLETGYMPGPKIMNFTYEGSALPR